MINEIRFVLYENDIELRNILLEKMKPFNSDNYVIEENGDAGTTITIIFSIIQTVLALPSFAIAMYELINILNQKNKVNTEKQGNLEKSNVRWKISIDGYEYDLTELSSEEERKRVFDSILKEHIGNERT